MLAMDTPFFKSCFSESLIFPASSVCVTQPMLGCTVLESRRPPCSRTLASALQDFAFILYRVEQLLPRFVKGLGALRLEICSKLVEIDSCLSKSCQNGFAVSSISRKRTGHGTVLAESEQCFLRYSVDRVWRGKRIDVENIRCAGIFGASARKEQTLLARAEISQALPAVGLQYIPILFVDLLPHGDTQFIAQRVWNLVHGCAVPTAQKHRCNGADIRAESRIDAAFEAAHVCLCRCEVLVTREEKRDVDGDAICNRFFYRWNPLTCPGNLDVQIWTIPFIVKKLCGGYRLVGVISHERRQLQRNEPIDACGLFVNGREQIGCSRQIMQRQFEEHIFSRESPFHE